MTVQDGTMSFRIIMGTAGLTLHDVAHVLVPGRGRDDTGHGLTDEALDRVTVARELYDDVVSPAGGRIVCSGYKSPIDRKGAPWSPRGAPDQVFTGVPEADLMKRELVRLGVPAGAVSAERHSIDTVTNFLRSELEDHFGDDRPVAIVAQADHLRRIIDVIAPRTLRRGFLGVVVPQDRPVAESPLVTLASRIIVARLPDEPHGAIVRATARANLVWRTAMLAGRRNYP